VIRDRNHRVGPHDLGILRRLGVIAITLIVLGCSTSNPSGPPGTGGPAVGPLGTPSADQVLQYGFAPNQVSNVTYQPDVVLISAGASAIRWASSTGLVWGLVASAPGVAGLQVGQVLFLTSRAVGRIAAIDDEGDTRAVTLAPVALTEVLQDATINIDQDIDFAQLAYQEIPDLPENLPDPSTAPTSGADGTIEMPPIRLVGANPASNPAAPLTALDTKTLPPTKKGCIDVTVGSWTLKPCLAPNKITIGVDYKTGASLKLGGSIDFVVDNLHTQAVTVVKDGTIVDNGMQIEGLKGFDINVSAGSATGASGNDKLKLEIPIEAEFPVVVGGLPMNFVFEFKLLVETAFSGNNSTLQASGQYSLTGPIGISAGKPLTPKLGVVQSLLDGLGGVTVGVSGVVIAAKIKAQFGVGMPGLVVGPYGTFTASVGVTKGSVLGGALVTCRGATLDLWVGGGAGFTINLSKFETFLPASIKKVKLESPEANVNVFHASQTLPDVPACR
jgi:hypothetical protein